MAELRPETTVLADTIWLYDLLIKAAIDEERVVEGKRNLSWVEQWGRCPWEKEKRASGSKREKEIGRQQLEGQEEDEALSKDRMQTPAREKHQ